MTDSSTRPDLRATLQSALGKTHTLERELGGGGMSRVFVAQEEALGRTVVVKVLAPELAQGLSAERFAREVRLAARLQHPNIVPVLSAGDAGGLPYYTMPFVRGESLRARLAHGAPLPVADVVSVMRDVARALAYAHGEGVVHRDIKPDNVLLSGGVAMVADFGIARAISASVTAGGSVTTAGVALGSPGYMAPEQALADPAADHRVDLYALGVLAWEALTGRPIFGNRTFQALIAAHVAEMPEDVATRRADVPRGLTALVMQLLAKSPEDRPSSADEVLRLLDGVETSRVAAPLNGSARPSTRPRAGAHTVLTVGVALVALGAGAMWWRQRAAPKDASLTVVAIAPFRVSGADASLHYLREGMVDLLAAKVDGTGGLRAIDPRTTLVAWRRAADGDADLSSDDALRVSRSIGAGSLILGELAGSGANVTVSATLLPAPRGREPVRATVSGPVDSLPALVDRLAAQLGSLGAGEQAPHLVALTSTSLPALRAYLDGRSLYRRGRANEAMASYTRALQLDSSFVLAALGLVRTVGWGGQTAADQARALALGGPIIWRSRARLAPVDAALAEATLGPRYPAPRTYPEWFAAAERLTSLAPDNAEGWFELGDALYHGGGVLDKTDADETALRAFSRSISLDSAFVPSFIHLGGLYAEMGDSAHYRQLFEISRRRDSTVARTFYALHLALLEGDSVRARSFRADMERLPRPILMGIIPAALYGHRGLDYAQRAVDLLSSQSVTSAERLALAIWSLRIPIERGRPREAAAHVSQLLESPPIARAVALASVFADGDSVSGAAAARTLEPIVAVALRTASPSTHSVDTTAARPDLALAERVDDALVLAQYRLAIGDVSVARRVVPWLRAYVAPKDSTWLAEIVEERALLLDAQVAAREQRPDAGAVLARLDSATRFGHHDVRFTSIAGRVAARLWEERGDARRALEALRRRGRGIEANFFETAWQREVGRLATIVGDHEAAIRAYRIYLIRRLNPEPALAAEVAHVRAELERLERASAGR